MRFQVEIFRDFYIDDKKPTIFAVTHIGKWDFEIVNEILKPQFYILAADFIHTYGTISGIMLKMFGVIYVDECDKEDKRNSKCMLEAVLNQGGNVMIFPEGTWNLSENEIIYDIPFGTVDIALNTNAVIVPIAVEQYGKRFVVNIGKSFQPKEKVKDTVILRDILATLKWEIWEKEGICSRREIPYDYWSRFIIGRLNEWRGYNMHEQIINCFLPRVKKEYFDILRTIRRMKIHKKNCFMIMNKEVFLEITKN